MKNNLRVQKKHYLGVFAINTVTLETVDTIDENQADAFLDCVEKYHHEIIPRTTASNLRKAFRSGQPVDVNVMGTSPDTRLRHGWCAVYGRGKLKLALTGPAYSLNVHTEHQIAERISKVTGIAVDVIESSNDALGRPTPEA